MWRHRSETVIIMSRWSFQKQPAYTSLSRTRAGGKVIFRVRHFGRYATLHLVRYT